MEANLASMVDDDEYNKIIFALSGDISKNSGAWEEFSKQIGEDHAQKIKTFMEDPLYKMKIKQWFEEADAEKKGYLNYGTTSKSFQAFLNPAIDHLNLPKPKGGELVYRKLFQRFQDGKKLELKDCEKMITTMGHVIVHSFNLTVANVALKSYVKQMKESGAWEEFKKTLKDKNMVMTSTDEVMEKLQSGELKRFFDEADNGNKGELSWYKGEVVTFMRNALGLFGFPAPKGGEMVYFKMFKGFAKLNERTITYNECVRMIAVVRTCTSRGSLIDSGPRGLPVPSTGPGSLEPLAEAWKQGSLRAHVSLLFRVGERGPPR